MDSLRKQPSSPKTHLETVSFIEKSPVLINQKKQATKSFPRPKKVFQRFFLWLFGFLGVIGCVIIVLLFLGQVTFTHSLNFENRELSLFETLKVVGKGWFQKEVLLHGEESGRINILLLGRAGEHYPGKNLTDTVMVASFDMVKKRIGLLSLPRDLFVPIVGTDTSTKINSLYQIGLNEKVGTELLRESVTEITSLPIHYTILIDFDGFERVIDALGGISLDVPRALHDTRYPGKNYSYETFSIEAGFQKLDGKTALKYARERHADPEGDFGRAKRQQAILQATRERALSLPTFLNPFTLIRFLENLGGSVTTDIPPESIDRFIQIGKTFDTRNLHSAVVDAWKKESLLRVDHLDTPSGRAFLLVPRHGDWEEVRELAQNIFEENRGTLLWERMLKEKVTLTLLTAPSKQAIVQKFKDAIGNDFPIEDITIVTLPQLERSPETAMIVDRRALQKPFALDALIKRYDLTKVDYLPIFGLPKTIESDYLILFTHDSFTDTPPELPSDINTDQYDFQEPLSPQKTR